MYNICCSECGGEFAPYEIKEHRSFHYRTALIQRRYSGDAYHPSNIRKKWKEGINLIEKDVSPNRIFTYEGAEILAHVEFTYYLYRTRNYISFEEFLDKKIPSEIKSSKSYIEDILFFKKEAHLYKKIMKKTNR